MSLLNHSCVGYQLRRFHQSDYCVVEQGQKSMEMDHYDVVRFTSEVLEYLDLQVSFELFLASNHFENH